MEPNEIRLGGAEGRVLGWMCTACETPWLSAGFENAHARASSCCSALCSRCGGAVESIGVLLCAACLEAREFAAEVRRFAGATKIALADYAGEMVYLPREEEGGYVATEDALKEAQERGLSYVWATQIEEADFNLEDALSCYIGDQHHEDAYDWVDAKLVAEAQALIDRAIKAVRTFREDPTIAILIPPLAIDERPDAGEDDGAAAPRSGEPAAP